MIEYDPDKGLYVDLATGNHAKFKRIEPRESWIQIDFHWSTKRFGFFATLRPWAMQGPLTFQVLKSSYFEPSRAVWVDFRDMAELTQALRPFVFAWSSRAWEGRIVHFHDNRGDSGHTLEEATKRALGPPSQKALQQLVSEFERRNRDSMSS